MEAGRPPRPSAQPWAAPSAPSPGEQAAEQMSSGSAGTRSQEIVQFVANSCRLADGPTGRPLARKGLLAHQAVCKPVWRRSEPCGKGSGRYRLAERAACFLILAGNRRIRAYLLKIPAAGRMPVEGAPTAVRVAQGVRLSAPTERRQRACACEAAAADASATTAVARPNQVYRDRICITTRPSYAQLDRLSRG